MIKRRYAIRYIKDMYTTIGEPNKTTGFMSIDIEIKVLRSLAIRELFLKKNPDFKAVSFIQLRNHKLGLGSEEFEAFVKNFPTNPMAE